MYEAGRWLCSEFGLASSIVNSREPFVVLSGSFKEDILVGLHMAIVSFCCRIAFATPSGRICNIISRRMSVGEILTILLIFGPPGIDMMCEVLQDMAFWKKQQLAPATDADSR